MRLAPVTPGFWSNDPGWYPDSSCAVRNIRQNDGHTPDPTTITDVDITKHLSVGSQFNIVSQDGYRPPLLSIADRNSLSQRTVGSNHSSWMNKHTAEMPNA